MWELGGDMWGLAVKGVNYGGFSAELGAFKGKTVIWKFLGGF
jgi:hypothetical protein